MNFITKNETFPSTCSACGAQNYDSYYRTGERVDAIYEIRIGSMLNCLCADCLSKLKDEISGLIG